MASQLKNTSSSLVQNKEDFPIVPENLPTTKLWHIFIVSQNFNKSSVTEQVLWVKLEATGMTLVTLKTISLHLWRTQAYLHGNAVRVPNKAANVTVLYGMVQPLDSMTRSQSPPGRSSDIGKLMISNLMNGCHVLMLNLVEIQPQNKRNNVGAKTSQHTSHIDVLMKETSASVTEVGLFMVLSLAPIRNHLISSEPSNFQWL